MDGEGDNGEFNKAITASILNALLFFDDKLRGRNMPSEYVQSPINPWNHILRAKAYRGAQTDVLFISSVNDSGPTACCEMVYLMQSTLP